MNKAALRQKYKAHRNQLNPSEIENLSLQIANQTLQLDIWDHSFYHLFLSISEQKEIDTDFILNILSGKDKHILLSKCNFDNGKMNHFLLTDNTTIKKNSYNIPEPVDGIEIQSVKIDVVFIPLLAFDQQGHRVGYGEGFYDAFLAECRHDTIKIGLSFFDAEAVIDDIYSSDIKLNYCVTPTKIYSFSN